MHCYINAVNVQICLFDMFLKHVYFLRKDEEGCVITENFNNENGPSLKQEENKLPDDKSAEQVSYDMSAVVT